MTSRYHGIARYRPELEPDAEPVLFLVGMRINHVLRPWTWPPNA
jgi:hypothetical protein